METYIPQTKQELLVRFEVTIAILAHLNQMGKVEADRWILHKLAEHRYKDKLFLRRIVTHCGGKWILFDSNLWRSAQLSHKDEVPNPNRSPNRIFTSRSQ